MLATVTIELQKEQIHRKSLGESRTEHSQRFNHLLTISNKYQELAKRSLSNPDALPDANMKLRGQSKNAIRGYTEQMTDIGHKYSFLKVGDSVENYNENDLDADSEDETDGGLASVVRIHHRHKAISMMHLSISSTC